MPNQEGIPASAVSKERHQITDFSEAGLCGSEFRDKVATVLEQLDGDSILVYIRRLDGGETIEQLTKLVEP
jgi:hypothetical protein